MPTFPKPSFPYTVRVADEQRHLRDHKVTRGIPSRTSDRLLVSSWNVANFGAQVRDDEHIQVLAEIISWFDLVALQEVRDNYLDLERVLHALPGQWRYLMSDVAGNDERLAFLFRYPKVRRLELIGEVAIPPSAHRHIKLPGVKEEFKGFDRNPYLAAFGAGGSSFLLANVHSYFGSQNSAAQKKASMGRRALETYAIARWADIERTSKTSFTREIIALGDMNMPKRDPADPIFNAITKRGMIVPEHSAKIASSIASDAEYDQVAMFPGATQDRLTAGVGVFDFDTVIFPDLWVSKTQAQFRSYIRYYISDHRPVWFELKIAG